MEHLEVVIFDEIDDYSEKIKGLTFRQWVFVAIALLVVIPTYLLIPKFTPLTKDLVSYIVIIEAAVIGFLGFVKIQNLNAEQIMPFWYRHFIVYKKPIEYMADEQWEKSHDKKNKRSTKSKKNEKIVISAKGTGKRKAVTDEISRQPQEENKPTAIVEKPLEIENTPKLTKKQLKQQRKQEKMLKKAQAKFGYMFNDENDNQSVVEAENSQEPVSKEEILMTEALIEQPEKNKEEQSVEVNEELKNDEDSKIDTVFNSLSPEERKNLLKKLVNDE